VPTSCEADLPYFILPAIWVLCVLIGLILLPFAQLRLAGVRLILASTGGLFGALCLSVILPMAILLTLKLLNRPTLDWLAAIGFIAGLLGGGVVGAFGGISVARRIRKISVQ
jgi:hypothetical protein